MGGMYFYSLDIFEHIDEKKLILEGFSPCTLLLYPAPGDSIEMKTSLGVVVCSIGSLSLCVHGRQEGSE